MNPFNRNDYNIHQLKHMYTASDVGKLYQGKI